MNNSIRAFSANIESKCLHVEDALRREAFTGSKAELERFTYSVAHDLLGPLMRASSSCQALIEDHTNQLDHDARRWVELAMHHIAQAQKRVVALRGLSEVLTEGQPTEPTDANLAFQEVTARLASQIAHGAAKVSCGPMGWVLADGSQFTLLLEHLVTNGLKFAGNQVPVIEVGRVTHSQLCNGELSQPLGMQSPMPELAHFFVRDNGVGIAGESLESIFFPFHQLQPPADRLGDGIGLALCRRIVQRHGGTLWAESTVGVGSVFYFTMPTCEVLC